MLRWEARGGAGEQVRAACVGRPLARPAALASSNFYSTSKSLTAATAVSTGVGAGTPVPLAELEYTTSAEQFGLYRNNA